MIKLQIKNSNDEVIFSQDGEFIDVTYNNEYFEGDYIYIETKSTHVIMQLDKELVESMVYLPNGTMVYSIPFGEKHLAYSDDAFMGTSHVIKARPATDIEIKTYRNLALNSTDKRGVEDYFPHAKANFVTRDESVFEERNSIDGVIRNEIHGFYPHQSWGGGAREDLDYKLYFGRPVEIDKIVFYLRAEFENGHDTYWKTLTLKLSDGTSIDVEFEKTVKPQEVLLGEMKTVEWIHLTNFKQAADPLTWAALSQILVFGKDA